MSVNRRAFFAAILSPLVATAAVFPNHSSKTQIRSTLVEPDAWHSRSGLIEPKTIEASYFLYHFQKGPCEASGPSFPVSWATSFKILCEDREISSVRSVDTRAQSFTEYVDEKPDFTDSLGNVHYLVNEHTPYREVEGKTFFIRFPYARRFSVRTMGSPDPRCVRDVEEVWKVTNGSFRKLF